MIQITTVGRVTADLELKESAKKVPYLRFDWQLQRDMARESTRYFCHAGLSSP